MLTEEINGELAVSYQHGAGGEMVSQTRHDVDTGGDEEESFYGYNPHGDIAAITDETGNTRATYGYTAYGSDDQTLFTGVDRPDPGDPTGQEPYNAYRYASQRFNSATGTYDMGFRDYSPGLNRFLTRDMFNGALADMSLGTNPWTLGRYTFAGGNPTSRIEIDGHIATCTPDGYHYCPDYSIGDQPTITRSETAANPDLDGGAAPPIAPPMAPPVTPPIPFTPAPPAAPPPGLRGGLRAGLLGATALCLLLCLTGDAGPDAAFYVRRNLSDYEHECASRTNSLSRIDYFPLDGHGRAAGAVACLTPSATRLDEREPATPPGYQSGMGMEKGHLIARQFGGTSNVVNIVAQYLRANDEMQRVENEVRRRLDRNERVFFAVIPRYDGDDPIPTWLIIIVNSASGDLVYTIRNSP